MIRILVMHPRDWLGRDASYVEKSIHEVLLRIVAQGHYVAWLCGRRASLPFRGTHSPELETRDGIHLARLGPLFLHRPFAKLFLDRLAKSGPCPFDIVLNCVAGRPLDVASHLRVPVLPWVFTIPGGIPLPGAATGPVIAATQLGTNQLRSLGVPPGHIVFAPVGVDSTQKTARPAQSGKQVLMLGRLGGGLPLSMSRARLISRLKARGVAISGNRSQVTNPWVVYCGKNHEWEALEFACRGIPVICPNTSDARECVAAEVSGLLHKAGDWQELENHFERILTDEVLYRRLSEGAEKHAAQRLWDRSAGLVLAAIENMLTGVS